MTSECCYNVVNAGTRLRKLSRFWIYLKKCVENYSSATLILRPELEKHPATMGVAVINAAHGDVTLCRPTGRRGISLDRERVGLIEVCRPHVQWQEQRGDNHQ